MKPDIKQCWHWRGGREPQGYGTFDLSNGMTAKAHRVAYVIHYGEDIPEMLTRHNCDNPPCCNPHHLQKGTDLDNSHDARDRGRLRPNPTNTHARGSKVAKAKLTEDQVLEIRRLHDECSISQKRLAEIYGVKGCTIHNVVRRKLWTHI